MRMRRRRYGRRSVRSRRGYPVRRSRRRRMRRRVVRAIRIGYRY